MYDTLNAIVGGLAKTLALMGGAVLLLLVAMTTISIIGRSLIPLGLNQIPGDFELVEFGVGFAIFSFLPWCQFNKGHARVDLFAAAYGTGANRVIDLIADILMFAISVLIAWRLWLGLQDKLGYGETTFILQFPVWYGYAGALFGTAVFVLVSAFCILRSAREIGRPAQ